LLHFIYITAFVVFNTVSMSTVQKCRYSRTLLLFSTRTRNFFVMIRIWKYQLTSNGNIFVNVVMVNHSNLWRQF